MNPKILGLSFSIDLYLCHWAHALFAAYVGTLANSSLAESGLLGSSDIFRIVFFMPDLITCPVTAANWTDFAALFESRGGPHYCWRAVYRFPGQSHMKNAEKKSAMRRMVRDSVPVGVLAYDGDKPVGWCSIAPRESYRRLERSRKMPRVTPPEKRTWTVLCFYVPRLYRGRSVSTVLLRGAIDYARSQGAQVVEAYPFDTAGNSSTDRGHSSLFRGEGFHRDGQRWSLALNLA